jgi:hypothetical protein
MRTLLIALLLSAPGTWDFEKDEPGKAPAGFETATTNGPEGKWEVVKDGDAKVLAQLDASQIKTRFAIAVAKDVSLKDLSLSVRGKPVSGKTDQSMGVVWRYKDANNYYLVRTNVLEQNLSLYRVVDGKRKEIDGKDYVALKTGEWQALKVEHRGASIAVFLNGQKVLECQDKTFPDAGKVGVWIKADSVTHFDDLSAEELK